MPLRFVFDVALSWIPPLAILQDSTSQLSCPRPVEVPRRCQALLNIMDSDGNRPPITTIRAPTDGKDASPQWETLRQWPYGKWREYFTISCTRILPLFSPKSRRGWSCAKSLPACSFTLPEVATKLHREIRLRERKLPAALMVRLASDSWVLWVGLDEELQLRSGSRTVPEGFVH